MQARFPGPPLPEAPLPEAAAFAGGGARAGAAFAAATASIARHNTNGLPVGVTNNPIVSK